MTITTIKRITPDIEASVINQFKAWAQTKSGQDILMDFDTWHAFEVE